MHCSFHVEGAHPLEWAEDRKDLPLYQGGTVVHDGRLYEIVAEPSYQILGERPAITASFRVKPATINS
jgi:hypothetical protein